MTWPADVPVPEGAKRFDPQGPLSQVDALAADLDPKNPFVQTVLQLKELKVALEKLEAENNAVRPRDAHRRSRPWRPLGCADCDSSCSRMVAAGPSSDRGCI